MAQFRHLYNVTGQSAIFRRKSMQSRRIADKPVAGNIMFHIQPDQYRVIELHKKLLSVPLAIFFLILPRGEVKNMYAR